MISVGWLPTLLIEMTSKRSNHETQCFLGGLVWFERLAIAYKNLTCRHRVLLKSVGFLWFDQNGYYS